MRKLAFVAVAVVVLSLTVAATPNSSDDGTDPYVVSVQSERQANGSVTVKLSVTEKATNAIVFSPRINTRPGIPAEATTDGENGRSFEARIVVDSAGTVTVVFKAYERLLQRSVVRT
jgi:hypothetical protein